MHGALLVALARASVMYPYAPLSTRTSPIRWRNRPKCPQNSDKGGELSGLGTSD